MIIYEQCLKAKSMTQQPKKFFFSAVASSMLTYKKYPSPKDFVGVYRSIVEKYPFLEANPGSQQVYIINNYNDLMLIFNIKNPLYRKLSLHL